MDERGRDESQILARLRSGDAAALEHLFRTYAVTVVRFATACTGDRDIAEDLTQDIFAWIWENRENWNPPRDLQAYLLTAVRNRARNRLRDATRRDTIARSLENTEAELPDQELERFERESQMRSLVAGLPDVQRMLLVLRWEQGMAWERIAAILGVTVEAARKQHSRLLAVLRERHPG